MSEGSERYSQASQAIDQAGDLLDSRHPVEVLEALVRVGVEYAQAIEESPKLTASHSGMLGLAYYHIDRVESPKGRYFLERAIEAFSTLIDIRPDAENSLFMRAKCFDYLGEVESGGPRSLDSR